MQMWRFSKLHDNSNPISFPFEHSGAGGAKHKLPLKAMLLLTGASFASAIGSEAAAACTPITINGQQTSILCTNNDSNGFLTTGDAFDLTVESNATVIDNSVSNSGVIQLWDLDASNDPQIINNIIVDGTIRDDSAQLDFNEDLIIDNTIPPASGVYVEGNVGGNITVGNDARIIVAEHGFEIDGDTGLVGDFTNNGLIATGKNGISVNAIGGEFTNSGTIDGDEGGLVVTTSVGENIIHTGAIENALTNDGTISAGDGHAIEIGDSVIGGIFNNGDITAQNGNAIFVDGNFTGFENTEDGVISSTDNAIDAQVVSGDFTNAGDIISTNGAGVQFELFGNNSFSTTEFTNEATGKIDAAGDGVNINSHFYANFTNDGSIVAGEDGVHVGGGTFEGTFTNSGVIVAGEYGLNVSLGKVGGSIITEVGSNIDAGLDGIYVNSNVFGNVNNAGDIKAGKIGINISGGTLEGSFNNSGTIDATSSLSTYGIQIDAIGGDFTNEFGGEVYARDDAVLIDTIAGGFANSGRLESSNGNGVRILGDLGGDFDNTSTGTIAGTGYGVTVSGNIDGDFHNVGTIFAAQARGVS